jgi:hypothetical protein
MYIVKNANGVPFTCVTFQETIQEYVDDELSGETAIAFLNHSVMCESCHAKLHDMLRLKITLSTISPVTISSTFDSRLRERIYREEIRLQSPWYRFSLSLQANTRPLIAMAFIIFFVTAMIFFARYSFNYQNVSSVVLELKNKFHPNVEEPIEHETVNYILDSVKSSEVESGIFLHELAPLKPDRDRVTNQHLRLVSF